jgi:cation diffusion facilitator CzcD-associated flavoprotein CzcO
MSQLWSDKPPVVAIIGAGFGGICMAAQLKRAGITTFTIFEKAADVGGIWRDNTYPGCGCDVPSHLYSYSFEKYRSSTLRYPAQTEILEYLHAVRDQYALREHLRLNAEIVAARYDDATARWTLTTVHGESHDADIVVYAVGQLDRPRLPEIPGRETFTGPAFHSARWNHDLDVAGKDVGVIGTGSSAAQLIPHVADKARRLYVFQRSANWVIPKPSPEFGGLTRAAFKHLPALQTAYRGLVYVAADSVLWPVITRGWSARPVEWVARRHLRRTVADERLRRRLEPGHPVGCKRVVIDSNFYRAMNRENVELVTEKIVRIHPDKIETAGGFRAVDALVYATGFRTTEFLGPLRVYGKSGRNLHDDQWRDGAEAYLGVAVPNFPNMFFLHGPNTILGHNSNVFIIECQVRYVMQCLQMLSTGRARAIEVTPQAMDEYKGWLDRAIGRTVWPAGCQSWYKTESGRVTNPWPASSWTYRRLLRRPRREAFSLVGDRAMAVSAA